MTTAQFNPSGLPLSKPTGVLPSPAKVGTPPIPVNEHKENQQAKETAPPKEVAPTPAPKPAPANTTTPPPAKLRKSKSQ